MNNAETDTVVMLNPDQCSQIVFWTMFSKVINEAVKVDVPIIERIISICSSNPLLKEEMIFLQLILEISKNLAAQSSARVIPEAKNER